MPSPRTRRTTAAVSGSLVFLVLTGACGGGLPNGDGVTSGTPNVLVLLLDCLRADHLGTCGYERPTSPQIDALGRDGIVFERTVAQSNWTRPSVASLFSSLYVGQHRVPTGDREQEPEGGIASGVLGRRGGNVLSEDYTTLAEAFQRAGYATAAFIHQAQMPEYMGFAQGFDVYDVEKKNDRRVLDRFSDWVEGPVATRDAPFFAYLHFLKLHFPYRPAERRDVFRTERTLPPLGGDHDEESRFMQRLELLPEHRDELMALYDSELMFLDNLVGDAVDYLQRTGRYDDTLILLTSDHGEAFYEHGTYKHAGESLYGELLHVPIILKLPRGQHSGRRTDVLAEMVDMMPTLLDAAALPVPEGLAGNSLLPLLDVSPGDLGTQLAFAEVPARGTIKAVYVDSAKYIFDFAANTVEVYDLASDPGEARDRGADWPAEQIERARTLLRERMEENALFAASHPLVERELEEEDLERLRAMGYIQ